MMRLRRTGLLLFGRFGRGRSYSSALERRQPAFSGRNEAPAPLMTEYERHAAERMSDNDGASKLNSSVTYRLPISAICIARSMKLLQEMSQLELWATSNTARFKRADQQDRKFEVSEAVLRCMPRLSPYTTSLFGLLRLLVAYRSSPAELLAINDDLLRLTEGEHESYIKVYQLAAAMQQNRIRPDLQTFKCLLTACEKNRYITLASNLYKELLAFGLTPDRDVFNKLIAVIHKRNILVRYLIRFKTAASVGYIELAFEYFHDLTDVRGMAPDQRTIDELIRACVVREDVPVMEYVFKLRDQYGLSESESLLRNVFDTYNKAGYLAEAFAFIESNEDKLKQPDELYYSVMYRAATFDEVRYIVGATRPN